MVPEFESLKQLNDHFTDSSAFEYQPNEPFQPAEVSTVKFSLNDSILIDEDQQNYAELVQNLEESSNRLRKKQKNKKTTIIRALIGLLIFIIVAFSIELYRYNINLDEANKILTSDYGLIKGATQTKLWNQMYPISMQGLLPKFYKYAGKKITLPLLTYNEWDCLGEDSPAMCFGFKSLISNKMIGPVRIVFTNGTIIEATYQNDVAHGLMRRI